MQHMTWLFNTNDSQ